MILDAKSNLVEVAREVAPVLAAHAAAVDEQNRFPEESLRALQASGLMGLLVPATYGGLGASYQTMVEVIRILAGACLSTGMIWAMHCQQVATLVDHAAEPLRRRVLPRIAVDGMFVASVTTEREKGGHLLSAYAPLLLDGDDVLLVREAPVVTGGAFGDGYLITMRASAESSPAEVVLVFAERAQLEVDFQAGWQALGMRGTQSVAMSLKGRLPPDQLVDPAGGFAHVAMSTLIPVGHIAWSAAWLGAAQGAFQQMMAVWRDPQARKGFNLQSDLFAARLAQVRLQLDAVDAYLDRVVREYTALLSDQGINNPELKAARFNIHINNLKLLASDQLFRAIDQLTQLSGLRYGYLKNDRVSLERTFRDLRSASLMYTNDRLLVANGKLALMDRDGAPA